MRSGPTVEPESVAVDAQQTRPWLELAREAEQTGDLDAAISAYERAAGHEAEAVEAYESLSRVAHLAGQHEARVMALQQLVSRASPNDRLDALKALARALSDAGETERAEILWKKIAQEAPADEDADLALEEGADAK